MCGKLFTIYLIFSFFINNCSLVFCENENKTVEKVLAQLTNLLEILEVSKDGNPEDTSLSILPPKYMLDLYQKYAQEILPYKDSTLVRCILGKVRRESVHFNLSALSSNDQILQAQVHVFSRKGRHGRISRLKFKTTQIRYSLKKVLFTVVPLAPRKGWQILDVTKTVRSYKRKRKYLKMTVEAPGPAFGSGHEKYYTLALSEILYTTYKPFLLVFSRERREKLSFSALPLLETHLLPEGEATNSKTCTSEAKELLSEEEEEEPPQRTKQLDDFDILQNGLSTMFVHENKENRFHARDINFYDNENNSEQGNEIDSGEKEQHLDSFKLEHLNHGDISYLRKRSVQDNQLTPDDFESYRSPFNFVSSIYQENPLPSLHDDGVSRNEKDKGDDEPIEQQDDDDGLDAFLLPTLRKRKYIGTSRTMNKKKQDKAGVKHSNKENSKINGRNFVSPNRKSTTPATTPPTQTPAKPCVVSKLTVDFGKIIAPPSFVFNYCRQLCSDYQVEKDDSFIENEIYGLISRHVVVRDLDSNCCIPTEKKRFSILFVDKHQNIVLRSYPNATIANCDCQ